MTRSDNGSKRQDNITLDEEERQPCEVWTRVMGYHRPYSYFNRGKKSEFAERKNFVVETRPV